MEYKEKVEHWDNIYSTKKFEEVSWFELVPKLSLDVVSKYCADKTADIIDVGGGVSYLSEYLLDSGYSKITVLDISKNAIETTKNRLGAKSSKINWIIADASDFQTDLYFDFWHDRAAFHFLNNEKDISNYIEMTNKYIKVNGYLVIGAFSEQGPTKCSGIEITQYSKEKLVNHFESKFDLVDCFNQDHTTPSGANQNFIYCIFKKH